MLEPDHPPITAEALAKRLGRDKDEVARELADACRRGEISGREFRGRNYYHGKDWQCTNNT